MRARRTVALVALTTIAALWAIFARAPNDAPIDARPDGARPGRTDLDEAAFFAAPTTGMTQVVQRSEDDEAAIATMGTESFPETPDEAHFVLSGATPDECHGVLSLLGAEGMRSSPFTGSRLVVPSPADRSRIDIAIDGFAIVNVLAPIRATDVPIEVPMRRAGTLVVDVHDTNGNALADRLLFFFVLDDARTSDDRVRYITSPWAHTDATGRAESRNVLPGRYRVDTDVIAEWRDATRKPVEVREGEVTVCSLTVPVLAPDEFGGFTIAATNVPFLARTEPGRIHRYAFRTDDGAEHLLYRVGDTIRCIVPGKLGDVVMGRIEWRERDDLHRPSQQSAPIRVTIGAVPAISTTWTEVPE